MGGRKQEWHAKEIQYRLPSGAVPCGWAMVTLFRRANGKRGVVVPWSVLPNIDTSDNETFNGLVGSVAVAVSKFVNEKKAARK